MNSAYNRIFVDQNTGEHVEVVWPMPTQVDVPESGYAATVTVTGLPEGRVEYLSWGLDALDCFLTGIAWAEQFLRRHEHPISHVDYPNLTLPALVNKGYGVAYDQGMAEIVETASRAMLRAVLEARRSGRRSAMRQLRKTEIATEE